MDYVQIVKNRTLEKVMYSGGIFSLWKELSVTAYDFSIVFLNPGK